MTRTNRTSEPDSQHTAPAAKTTVFNLIILDESGSMECVRNETIDGCNKVMATIREMEQAHSDTQRNLVSIYAFQSDNANRKSRYLCKNVPVARARDITARDYQPWGATPLLDAVGSTLVDLEAVASTHQDAHGIVTIITDGMENSSSHYTYPMVATIVNRLRELGWTVNLIGANIDVNNVGDSLGVSSRMAFTQSSEGTGKMFDKFRKSYAVNEESRIACEAAMPRMSEPERRKMRKSRSDKWID